MSTQDMTRAESGRELSRRNAFDLSATIAQAVELHRSEALSKGLSLEISEAPSGTPPLLFGDAVQIERALTNLLSNALRHTAAGSIRVDWGVMGAGDGLKPETPGFVTVGISVQVDFLPLSAKLCSRIVSVGRIQGSSIAPLFPPPKEMLILIQQLRPV